MEIRQVQHFDKGPLTGHTVIQIEKPSKKSGKKSRVDLLIPQDRTLNPKQTLRVLPRGAEHIGTAYPELFIRFMLSKGIQVAGFEAETHDGSFPLLRPPTIARFKTSPEQEDELRRVHDRHERFNYALTFLGRDEKKGLTVLNISGGKYGGKARMRLHDLFERLGVRGRFSILKRPGDD